MWPALNRAMAYVLRGGGLGMGMSGTDGLATTPTANGLPGEDHADNWLDIVNFGGKDGIINTYLITALNAMAEMATFLGDKSYAHTGGPGGWAKDAKYWQQLHARAVASFNAQFWNESVGLYVIVALQSGYIFGLQRLTSTAL